MAAKGAETLARLALGSRPGGANKWRLDKYYGDLNLQRRVGACLRLDLGARAARRVSHLNGGALKALEALREAEAGAHFRSAVLYASDIVGSDIAALVAAPETAREAHFDEVAQLLRTLGEGALPCVAILDGCVSGGALGVGAHASACVVTERTRASLPGPSHGYVPEGFVSYQLSRLPHAGLGCYLALTGAALTGQEMVELGLATHATESQAVGRIVHELSHQRARHLGRTLRNIEGVPHALAVPQPLHSRPHDPCQPRRVAISRPRQHTLAHGSCRPHQSHMRVPRLLVSRALRQLPASSLNTKSTPRDTLCTTWRTLARASPRRRSRPSSSASRRARRSGTRRRRTLLRPPRL